MSSLDKAIYRNRVSSLSAKPLILDYKGHKCDFKVCPHQKDNTVIYPCSPGYLNDTVHGARRIPRCKRWDCRYCGDLNTYNFEKSVEAFTLFHTLNPNCKNVLLTLTFYAECEEDCQLHWRQCLGLGHRKRAIGSRGWETKAQTRKDYTRKFMDRLRDELDISEDLRLAYCKVKEPTKAKVDHFHMIIGNVDRKYSERYMRNLSSRIWNEITGNSFVVDVRNTYGKPGKYLAKYLSKNYPKDGEITGRRYNWSQNAMLPPRAVKRYTLDHDTYEHPDGNITPYMQAFGTSTHFYGYHPEDIPPIGGILESRQACHHEDCELRLTHSRTGKEAFGDNYDAYMQWYLIHDEDKEKLV